MLSFKELIKNRIDVLSAIARGFNKLINPSKLKANLSVHLFSSYAELVIAGSVLVGLCYWLWTQSDRDNARYYAAWTEISSAPHAPNMQSQATKIHEPCQNPPTSQIGDSGRKISLEDLAGNDNSLSGAPLSYAVLPFTHLAGANLDRVDLRYADLFGADLQGVDMWAGQLQNANLTFAHLEGSHLKHAQLGQACLENAHLSRLVLNKLKSTVEDVVRNLHLEPSSLSSFHINARNFHLTTEMDKGITTSNWPLLVRIWRYIANIKINTDMSKSCLKNAHLSGANMRDINLTGANLRNAVLTRFDIDNWELLKERFIKIDKYGDSLDTKKAFDLYLAALAVIAKIRVNHPSHDDSAWPSTDLTGADLTGAVLTDADLTGAVLTDADLTDADLTGARGTTDKQINAAKYLCRTIMPNGVPLTRDGDCEKPSGTRSADNVCEAVEEPDVPGSYSRWTSGAKQGIGTSTTATSKIWYTIGNGILNEVYYPRIDLPNVEDLEFIVSDGSSFVDLERYDTDHKVQLLDPGALTYRQVNTKSGLYRITKTYVTDVKGPTLLIETRFEVLSGGPYQIYVLYNPSLNGSGMGDTAATYGNALVASDGSVASALIASSGFTAMSSGYKGTASDGLVDLNQHRQLSAQFASASTPGNIVQIGQISVDQDTTFTLALGFGSIRPKAVDNAQHALEVPFAQRRSEYEGGWHSYLAPLAVPKSVADSPLRTQYNVALMALKAHEDKTFPGAIIASLSTPWGDAINADRCCVAEKGGYQAVWARDLYQVATAQQAAGDVAAANRALDYLLYTQQLPDGSFPHNTLVDGTLVPNINCGFNCQQLDEVAFPIILAHQLGRTDTNTWKKLKKAADFLVAKGPFTPQERWEEAKGFSPSTIAAEIAALVCAAEMAQTNGDEAVAKIYRDKADNWQHNIEKWTFTTTSPHSNHQYYIRIDDNQNPNDGHSLKIANHGGIFDEREIVDAGFMELVRLGVKAPNDPHVIESLEKVDTTIKVNTPNGPMFHRYNHDGYGEEADCTPYPVNKGGIGRLWPLLTGERGEYELANGRSATTYLKAMALTANDGFMIAEQVSDINDCGFTFGKGTNSATPLAWSMAQFVRLALSIDTGKPIETPKVVADRYARETSPSTSRSP